jgi:TolA-binding protein
VSEIEYNPNCSRCRDLAGKHRAGIKDKELCVGHLQSRVRELEAELKHCQESEGWSKMMAMEGRIESLEAELLEKRQSIVLTATEADKNIDELEAERDRLKEELEYLKKDIQAENNELSLKAFNNIKQHLQLECDKIVQAYRIEFESENELRARHAALVEAARLYLKYSDTTVAPLEAKQLEAALAEMK